MRWLIGACVLGSVIAAAVFLIWKPLSPDYEEHLQLARRALLDGKFELAEQQALHIPPDHPLSTASRLIAGEAAVRSERYESAILHYGAIERDGSPSSVLAAFSLGEVYLHHGPLARAEECYRYVVAHEPTNATAHSRLAFLLRASGQKWESRAHYAALITLKSWTLQDLVLYGDLERPLEVSAYLRKVIASTPDDPWAQLGLATEDFFAGQLQSARRRLREIVADDRDLLAAQALLGETLVNADASAFLQWHAQLPASAEAHPDVWFVRGLWFNQTEQTQVATRCFWEAVRRAPTHRRAVYQLAQALVALNEPAGEEFSQRAAQLYDLGQLLDDALRTQGQEEHVLRRTTTRLQEIGRLWEAWAWALVSRDLFPRATWPKRVVAETAPLLGPATLRTVEAHNLALKHDLSRFRLPQPLLEPPDSSPSHPQRAPFSNAALTFQDEAHATGIDFVYINGDVDLDKPGARMFEQTGGGVAVLDFDRDGWPDLFFPQGTPWPLGSATPQPDPAITDRLFRNRDGAGFADVSQSASAGGSGFGQGAAIGDFDNDGFPDLYVANIGRNRLYRNNGDGTFSDVTESSGLELQDWTTSCALVDLNADGHPDLFDVNYVTGPRVFEILCDGFGCSPKNFDGISDRLLISNGDGTFSHIAGATPGKDSKGLGVVALDLYDRGRPSLYVANDQVPNFLLRNVPTDEPPGVRFQNEGFVSGVAFNEDGLAMAGMGIAVGDANADGQLDLFVTNFRDESNTLYLQYAPGLFMDATNVAGLSGPSLPYVGWGTQFLDADLDGYEDLVVVNGHIDDYRERGIAYHMPAQLFRNTGRARFEQVDPRSAGEFFKQKYLGRGLSRLDWNRDGRMDFAVSNMNSPAALATNRSANVGHFLNVRLTATRSARDAIGAVVHVVSAESNGSNSRTAMRQLTAGDGYMASNERLLQFGLASASRVESLTVEWPSGKTVSLRDLPVDVTLELVEGASSITVWDSAQVRSLPVSRHDSQ